MDSNSSNSHSSAIDIIKGLAIVSVVCLHSLTTHTLYDIGALLHVWQAVPVFMFLMGLNAASSLQRRGRLSVRELYSRDYLASRFDRLYVPFLVAFVATVIVTVLAHAAHDNARTIIAGLLIGTLPIDGPGNYFTTLAFQFVLVFPLVFRGLRRWPAATLLLCLAINLTFELFSRRVGVVKDHPYIYDVCLARYMLLVALGGLLARSSPRRLLAARWLWAGTLLSAAYLAVNSLDSSHGPFGSSGSSEWAFASVFYTVSIVVLGISRLPPRAHSRLSRGVAELGRASYHIFLVQIIWFGLTVWPLNSLLALVGNLAVTLTAGLMFYRSMASVPLLTLVGLQARRRISLEDRSARPIGRES